MTFQNPIWLWGLCVLPFFLIILRLWRERAKKNLESFIDPRLWQRMAPELDWRRPQRKQWIGLGAIALVLVSLARPQWGYKEEVVQISGLDLLFVLDISRSMAVEDVIPNHKSIELLSYFIPG